MAAKIKPLGQYAISGGWGWREPPFLTYGAYARRADALDDMAGMFDVDNRSAGLRKARRFGYRVVKVIVRAA